MSLSVDDLVASFSSNHIGQEAIDLAALQAQLAQVIFAQQSGLSIKPTKHIRPCNTPTSATVPCSWSRVSPIDEIEYQDERMVEELLIPATQAQVQTQSHFQTQTQTHHIYPSYHPPYSPASESFYPTFDPSQPCTAAPPHSSQFTSTDPFYIAQMQEMQRQGGTFTRLGRPDERSPFLLGAQSQ